VGGYSSKLATRQDPEGLRASVASPSHSLNGDPTPYTARLPVPENLAEHMPRGMSPSGGKPLGARADVPGPEPVAHEGGEGLLDRGPRLGNGFGGLPSEQEEARDRRSGDRHDQRRGQGPLPHPQIRRATVLQRSDGCIAGLVGIPARARLSRTGLPRSAAPDPAFYLGFAGGPLGSVQLSVPERVSPLKEEREPVRGPRDLLLRAPAETCRCRGVDCGEVSRSAAELPPSLPRFRNRSKYDAKRREPLSEKRADQRA
jgi:hypothetical protein